MPENNTLRGSEVQEFLSHKPHFFVRWGTTLFFGVLLSILTVAWLIEYPDLVTARARLDCINAPKEIVTRTEGRLTRILIKDNDKVQAGQILGYMESLADPPSVLQMSRQIDSINTLIAANRTNEIIRFFPDYSNQQELNHLGELQLSYQTFIQSFITFRDYLNNGFYLHKKAMLLTDLQKIRQLDSILVTQKDLLQKDLSLSDKTFTASESLAQEKVISSVDYRNEESKLIAKKLTLPQINASIVSNEAQQNEKKKEIAELENQIVIQKNTFIQALQTVKSQVQAWEYKYLLKSSLSGTVSFAGFFQENQEIKSGQVLFYVQPENTSYYVEMLIPQYNFGKVRPGQRVLLKFQAYPYEQYGAVLGKIEYINTIPSDSGYLAKVALPDGLVTNYKKSLPYRNGLMAQADIVTENMRLLRRFYYGIEKQLRR